MMSDGHIVFFIETFFSLCITLREPEDSFFPDEHLKILSNRDISFGSHSSP